MKKNVEAVRGTKDYLPKETIMRDHVKDVILSTYKNNGFMHIKTPILEDIELLGGSDSGDNTKLMFKILKRGDKLDLTKSNIVESDLTDLGLRYDLTVPLARFYAAHSNDLPKPFKSIQIDEAFRAERPQKGRLRQFTQCDIDILGDNSINAEIEVITVAGETLSKLGFKDFVFKINDRKILNNLIEYCGFDPEDSIKICISLDKLDKIGYEGVKEELIKKEYNEQSVDKIISILKLVKENGIEELSKYDLNKENIERINNIITSINALANGYKAEFDITIIRGQGYYTSTVMEVYLDGFNGACGGGGRYDNMIEKIVGINVPAIGFSIGYERVCLILSEKEFKQNTLALIYNNEDNIIDVLNYSKELRKDYTVHTVLKAKNLTNQLNKLKENGYNNFVFFNTKQIKPIG